MSGHIISFQAARLRIMAKRRAQAMQTASGRSNSNFLAQILCAAISTGQAGRWVRLDDVARTSGFTLEQLAAGARYAHTSGWLAHKADSVSLSDEGFKVAAQFCQKIDPHPPSVA
jgi:hypothetical protein